MKFNRPKAPSKFLRTDDIPGGKALVTIRGFSEENMAGENKPQQIKPVIWFNEFQKGMAFNQTNEVLMCAAFGLDVRNWDTDQAIGKKIVVYNDPSVQMNNEFVGGLRLRPANIRPTAQPATVQPVPQTQPQRQPGGMSSHFAGQPVQQPTYGDAPPSADEFDEDIPF
jgi:hypothetical protein